MLRVASGTPTTRVTITVVMNSEVAVMNLVTVDQKWDARRLGGREDLPHRAEQQGDHDQRPHLPVDPRHDLRQRDQQHQARAHHVGEQHQGALSCRSAHTPRAR